MDVRGIQVRRSLKLLHVHKTFQTPLPFAWQPLDTFQVLDAPIKALTASNLAVIDQKGDPTLQKLGRMDEWANGRPATASYSQGDGVRRRGEFAVDHISILVIVYEWCHPLLQNNNGGDKFGKLGDQLMREREDY